MAGMSASDMAEFEALIATPASVSGPSGDSGGSSGAKDAWSNYINVFSNNNGMCLFYLGYMVPLFSLLCN